MAEIFDMSSLEVASVSPIDPARLLEITKEKEREMSAQQATIEVLGKLSGEENNGLWLGDISLDARIANGEISAGELDSIADRVNRFYPTVSEGASDRCGDGSSSESYNRDSAISYARQLGPQNLGGDAGYAQAIRLWRGPDPEATLITDIDIAVNEYPSNYLPGDHTDDIVGEGATGCGAIDKYHTKIALLTDPSKQPAIKDMADVILASGNRFAPVGGFERIVKNAEAESKLEGYLPPAKNILDKLRSLNPNGVEVLVRPHREVSLTINWVSNTTFDRDAYNAETDSRICNFSMDAWAIFDRLGPELGYSAIIDSVLTAIAITDGSQILLVRRPSGAENGALAA